MSTAAFGTAGLDEERRNAARQAGSAASIRAHQYAGGTAGMLRFL